MQTRRMKKDIKFSKFKSCAALKWNVLYTIHLYTRLINISLSPVLELLPPLHKSGQTAASLDPSLVVSSKYVSYCSSDWLIDQQVKLKRVPWQKKPWILLYPPLNKLCLATFLWRVVSSKLDCSTGLHESQIFNEFEAPQPGISQLKSTNLQENYSFLESELDLQSWYFLSGPWHAITRRGDHNGPWMFSKTGIGRRRETRISEHPTPRPLPWLKPHNTGELRRKARKERWIQNWQKVIRFLACCRYLVSAASATISSLKLGLSAAPASDGGYRHARATWSFLLGSNQRGASWVHDLRGGSATTPGRLDIAVWVVRVPSDLLPYF